jgi:signal transduction histidine kinase
MAVTNSGAVAKATFRANACVVNRQLPSVVAPRSSEPEKAALAFFESLSRPGALLSPDGQILATTRGFQTAGLRASPEVLEAPRSEDGLTYRPRPEPLEGGGRVVWFDEVDSEGRSLSSQFLSVAAHDFRGVLANIRAYASMLKPPRVQLEPKAQRAVEVITRMTDRALALTDDFFDSVRWRQEPMPWDPQSPSASLLIEQALEKVEPLVAEHGVQLERLVPEDLPEVRVDEGRTVHALSAVLEHAVSRAQAGDRCGIWALGEHDGVRITVWNEHSRWSPEESARAFDRDFRVSRTRKLDAGFRFCIARGEVEAQGGSLDLKREGERVEVTLWLPKAAPLQSMRGAGLSAEERPGAPA